MNDDTARKWRRRRRRFRRRLRRAAEIAGLLAFVGVVLYTTVLHHPAKATKKRAGTTSTTVPSTQFTTPPALDAKMTSCQFANHAASAGVTITNHTPATLNYVVYVLFGNGTKSYGAGEVTVDLLASKASVDRTAILLSPKKKLLNLKCLIINVNRFA